MVVLAQADKKRSHDRSDDTNAADDQGVHHHLRLQHGIAKRHSSKQQSGDDGDHIGFKQIRRHARAIADIVADVIGNNRRISWVIFRDPGFDLADQIRADIGALGENAAAQTREDRNQRRAKAKPNQSVQDQTLAGIVGWIVHAHPRDDIGQIKIISSDAQKPKAHDQKPGHSARTESDIQGWLQTGFRRLCRADIGAHRNMHADESGGGGKHRAQGKADGDIFAQKPAQYRANHNADNGDGAVLAVQIGDRAFLNSGGDSAHAVVARRHRKYRARGEKAV